MLIIVASSYTWNTNGGGHLYDKADVNLAGQRVGTGLGRHAELSAVDRGGSAAALFIAAILGVHRGTVARARGRALNKLRKRP